VEKIGGRGTEEREGRGMKERGEMPARSGPLS